MKKNRILAALPVAALLIGFLIYRQAEMKQEVGDGLTRYTASFLDVFDTQTEIVGYGTSEEEFSEQVKLLKDKLTFYHNLYDIYHDYEGINSIKTINDNAGITPVVVDKEIIALLEYGKEMYEYTAGQVNVAMGSVLTIWHEYREEGISNPQKAKLPDMQELQTAAAHTDINQIVIDEEASTVYLADSKMSLDVGSIGKGYAVQRVAEYARELGIHNILLSVGGNVCAIGEKQDGSRWTLGIQNPDLKSDEEYSQKVKVKDESVVTSGNYQRYYTVDGVRYSHIVDPDTLMPADDFASVSIIAEDSGEADALSTAVYNMPFEEGLAYINSLEDIEAMWIFKDGSIEYSEHFQDYVVE